MRPFVISGRIIDHTAARGLPGLRIEAWDRERRCPDLVACAITDDDGGFHLSISEQHILELFGDHLPELTFRIFSGSTLLSDAPSGAVWHLGAPQPALRIRLDPGTSVPGGPAPAPFVVRGRAAHALTGPAPGVRVRAFDRRLSTGGPREILLGETTTDARGHYHVAYAIPDGAPGLGPTLVVRAFDPEGTQLAESPVLCCAAPVATLDLALGGGAWAGPSHDQIQTGHIQRHVSDWNSTA